MQSAIRASLLIALAIPCVPALAQRQGGGPPASFDVASVKQNTAGGATRFDLRGLRGGRINFTNVGLRDTIRLAWGGMDTVASYQVVGEPDWVRTTRFDIAATFTPLAEGATPAGRLPPPVAQMLRELLADRFQLRVREERRDLPVYALVPSRRDGSLGPSIKPSTVECGTAPASCLIRSGPGGFSGRGVGLNQLTAMLRTVAGVGRPVFDRTGWTGSFDFSLDFPQLSDPASHPEAVSVFTALEEQLGLKLEPRIEPYPVIVIERLEMPTAN